MKQELSALDAYTSRVYKIIVLIIPFFCICASATIVTLHYVGWYPEINELAMWLFVLSDLVYMMAGIYMMRTGFGEDGIVKPQKLKFAKYFITIILFIQWNGISYIWPFSDFWAYSVLFIIVEAFFFDIKLTAISTVGTVIFMFISWGVKGEMLLPPPGETFAAGMIFRLIGIVLMLASINLITYFGGKFLVEELGKYVNYDTLTHLLNRRSLGTHLERAHREAESGSVSFCILLLDIDHFKQINDSYGHDCGDEVLKSVAHTISAGTKKDDLVFRWGGEEILVLLKTDLQQALEVAERIRSDIEASPVNYRGEFSVPVTVTIGVSEYSEGISIQQMMDEADANLYHGKHHGRNRVISAFSKETRDTETKNMSGKGSQKR